MPHFLSISHYFFVILIACILWRFGVNDLSINPILVTLLTAIFLSSPSILMGGVYIRSAKIGLSFLVIYTLRFIYLLIKKIHCDPIFKPSLLNLIVLVFLCFFGALFDRQGFYFQIIYLVIVLIWMILFKDMRVISLIFSFFLSIILSTIYNYFFAPWLTFYFNGYYPDFNYQNLHLGTALKNLFNIGNNGFVLYLRTLGGVLGNTEENFTIVILIIFLSTVLFFLRVNKKNILLQYYFLTFLICSILIIAMLSLMAFKHPPLMWPDISKVVYYWTPTATFFTVFILISLSIFNKKYNIYCSFLFVVVFISNITHIPHNHDIFLNGHLNKYIVEGESLLADIKNIGLAKSSNTVISFNSKIYQFFLNRNK